MAADPKVLSECMLLFRNADPRLYDKFIGVLATYVTDLTEAVVEAPVDRVLIAQGQAKTARKFYQLFTELVREPNAPSPRSPR